MRAAFGAVRSSRPTGSSRCGAPAALTVSIYPDGRAAPSDAAWGRATEAGRAADANSAPARMSASGWWSCSRWCRDPGCRRATTGLGTPVSRSARCGARRAARPGSGRARDHGCSGRRRRRVRPSGARRDIGTDRPQRGRRRRWVRPRQATVSPIGTGRCGPLTCLFWVGAAVARACAARSGRVATGGRRAVSTAREPTPTVWAVHVYSTRAGRVPLGVSRLARVAAVTVVASPLEVVSRIGGSTVR